MGSLTICIVNWNAGAQLRDCISSIRNARKEGFVLSQVVIADNGSTDDSLDGIEDLGVPVRVLRNERNRGFAVACNQAAAAGAGDYILFLNPDTCLREDSLSAPIAFMDRAENTHVGICGIQMIDGAGRACLSYARFPTMGRFVLQAMGFMRTGREQQNRALTAGNDLPALAVDQVIGAFFLTRRSLFERLRGFDERFFVYYEEVDFSLRARNAGAASICLRDVTCMHAGGGTSKQVKAERLFYSLRSRILYGFKHFSRSSAAALVMITVLEFFSRTSYELARGAWQDLRHTVRGYALLIRDLPSILQCALGCETTLNRSRNEQRDR